MKQIIEMFGQIVRQIISVIMGEGVGCKSTLATAHDAAGYEADANSPKHERTNRFNNLWVANPQRLKKIIFLLICILTCTTVQAEYIFLDSFTPENNSEISSFEFVLHFDISNARAENPDIAGNLGVGYSGTSTVCTTLYKGNQTTGEVLANALTKTVNGKSELFNTSGDISISFPSITPVGGEIYTLVIKNAFTVYEKGGKSLGNDYKISYTDTPLVFSFVGKSSSENLILYSSSISNNSKKEILDNIELTFNSPIYISDNAKAMLMIDGQTYANALSFIVDPDNENSVIITFDNVPLYKTQSYQFVCEAGSILMKDDTSKSNEEFSLTIIGDATKPFVTKSLTPDAEYNGILTSATAKFELPQNAEFLETYGATTISYPAILYKMNGDDKELVANLKGTPLEKGDGVTWAIGCELLPETQYVINVPANSIYAYILDGSSMSGYRKYTECSNEEINFLFTTPTKENSGLPEFEFGIPFISDADGTHRVECPVDSEITEFTFLRLELKDKFYLYNGSSFRLMPNHDNDEDMMGTLYKISEDGERIKIKDFKCGGNTIYTADDYYRVITMTIESRLYEGNHYQIVIPEGLYTVNSDALKNFIQTPEIVLDYYGTSDSHLSLVCTSIRDGERMSSVSAVSFISDQDLVLTDSFARMILRAKDGDEIRNSTYTLGKSIYTESGASQTYTRIMSDFSNAKAYTPATLPETYDEYEIVIPQGSFALANDPAITNDEIVVNIKRIPETGLPEYINLTTVHSDHLTTVLPVEKGLKATIQLTPDQYWKVDALTFNGNDVTDDVAEDGSYTTSALRINSRLEASLAFDGNLEVSDETGVATLSDSNVKIYSDGDLIVVEGLTPGTDVTVYSISGHVLKSHTAAKDVVKVSAPRGAIYVVRIGNEAAKIQH